MKFGSKVTLGVIVIVGLVGLYLGDSYVTHKKEEEQKAAAVALYFKKEDVLKFSFTNKNGIVSFARHSARSSWEITQPEYLPADESMVDSLLTTFAHVSVQQELPQNKSLEDKTFLTQYGLDTPQLKIRIEIANKKSEELFVGHLLEIGPARKRGEYLPFSSAYALNPDRRSLLIVNSARLLRLENKSLMDFVSKRIGNFEDKTVTSVEIKSKNGVTKIATSSIIKKLLQQYQNLSAVDVLKAPQLHKRILENPAAIVSFRDGDNKIIQAFHLGIQKDGVYFAMKNDLVGRVDLEQWSDLIPAESTR